VISTSLPIGGASVVGGEIPGIEQVREERIKSRGVNQIFSLGKECIYFHRLIGEQRKSKGFKA
jgi:hypothetical protein